MRIPMETLAFYPSESEQKSLAEKARKGTIDASAGLRSTLSNSVPEKPRAKKAARKSLPPPESVHHEERRQHERREKTRPVVLDTRLGQRRRETRSGPSVNFEV